MKIIIYLSFILKIVTINSSEFHKDEKNCTPLTCPMSQGLCINNACECSYGFKTALKSKNNFSLKNFHEESESFCNYKQLCTTTAFFLEFLFPFGGGHLYAQNYKLAFLKFFSFSIFFCFICGEFFFIKIKLSALNRCHIFLAYTIVFDIFLWFLFHLVDLFCYGAGFYKDGNQIEFI